MKKIEYNWEASLKIGVSAVAGGIAATKLRDYAYKYITETAATKPDNYLVKYPMIPNVGLVVVGLFLPPLVGESEYSDMVYAAGAGMAAVGGAGLFRYFSTPEAERGTGLFGAIGQRKKGYYMRQINASGTDTTQIAASGTDSTQIAGMDRTEIASHKQAEYYPVTG